MRENLGGVPTAHPLGDLASKGACLSGILMPGLFRAVRAHDAGLFGAVLCARLHMSLAERVKKESHQTDMSSVVVVAGVTLVVVCGRLRA